MNFSCISTLNFHIENSRGKVSSSNAKSTVELRCASHGQLGIERWGQAAIVDLHNMIPTAIGVRLVCFPRVWQLKLLHAELYGFSE